MIGKRHCDAILSYRALIVASDPKSELPRPPPHLTTLPAELQLAIFKELHPVDSTCLGLACRLLYPIHRDLNGTVVLNAMYMVLNKCVFVRLAELLRQWGGRSGYWRRFEKDYETWTTGFIKCGLEGNTGAVCNCELGPGYIPRCRFGYDSRRQLVADEALRDFYLVND